MATFEAFRIKQILRWGNAHANFLATLVSMVSSKLKKVILCRACHEFSWLAMQNCDIRGYIGLRFSRENLDKLEAPIDKKLKKFTIYRRSYPSMEDEWFV